MRFSRNNQYQRNELRITVNRESRPINTKQIIFHGIFKTAADRVRFPRRKPPGRFILPKSLDTMLSQP